MNDNDNIKVINNIFENVQKFKNLLQNDSLTPKVF
jgi:hypothetical protein